MFYLSPQLIIKFYAYSLGVVSKNEYVLIFLFTYVRSKIDRLEGIDLGSGIWDLGSSLYTLKKNREPSQSLGSTFVPKNIFHF